MEAAEIEEFLTHLAVDKNVAASTQNQALSAILFLYQEVLHKDLDRPLDAVRAKKPKRLPTVLTKEEVQQVLAAMSGNYQLIAKLLYGSGLRLIECLRLRVKACPERSRRDVDFAQHQPALSLSKRHRARRQGEKGPHHRAPQQSHRAPSEAPPAR